MEELIQLNVDQFRQILMIPQGEFRELLVSDSKEKEVILQRLAHTVYYEKWKICYGKAKQAEILVVEARKKSGRALLNLVYRMWKFLERQRVKSVCYKTRPFKKNK
ncbi:hypothetical protein GCM10027614_84690 [Micromonospora vulcania]